MKTRFMLLLMMFFLFMGTTAAQDDIEAALQEYLATFADDQGPAVSARITVGEDTWAAAAGLVDIAGNTAATPDDLFRIGSISKVFMGVVLLQLVDEGVLSLDQTAADWLPGAVLNDLANADSATLEQLVGMTSGIPEYLADDFFNAVLDNPTRRWQPEDVLEFAYGYEALFAPGEGYEYTNTNYILLELIVETATGQQLHELFRERIFEPLDMQNTYTQVFETGTPFVHGYEDIDGDGVEDDVTSINDGAGLGDGGLISTTADLTRFYQGLFIEGELLSDEMLQLMVESGVEGGNDYGLALEVSEEDDFGLVIGHTGGVFGFTSAAFYAEEYDAIVVILFANNALDDTQVPALLELAAQAGE
jgi:CubicO group peptidase (beta-lactamase class C family)